MSKKSKDMMMWATIAYFSIVVVVWTPSLVEGLIPNSAESVGSEFNNTVYKIGNDGWTKTRAEVTAYVPRTERHGKFNDGKTAIGDDATVLDGVAVPPKAIPYRSKIYIPGIGIKEADDTGGALRNELEKGNLVIDLRVKDTETALEWGRRELTIFIKPNHED